MPELAYCDERLQALGIEPVLERVESPEEAERGRFVGSPTILIDGRDAFPTSDSSFGLTCRVYATPDGLAGCPTTEPSDVVLSCPVITSLKGPSGQEPGSSTL